MYAVLDAGTSKGLTDPFGSIPSGTTIVAVVNGTTVTLSQPATASGTGVLFNVAGRMPAPTQAILRISDLSVRLLQTEAERDALLVEVQRLRGERESAVNG